MSIKQLISQSLKRALCIAIVIGALTPVADAEQSNRSKNKKRSSSTTTRARSARSAKAKGAAVAKPVAVPDDIAEVQMSPDEATKAALKANKYRFEKSSLESVQELFGYDISQKDTMRISGFWLSQMRYSIPETLWKTFPSDTYASSAGSLSLKDMDATQRFPIGSRYEGFVLTQHANPEHFYMLWYDKNTEKFVGGPQTVGAEYTRGIMRYKTVSYLTENAQKQPVLTVCTRSIRTDDETCTDNCFSHYRIEVRTFKGGEWVSQYNMEQSNDGSKASYDIDCNDSYTKRQLQANIQNIFGTYVPKFLEAGEFRNTTASASNTSH